MANAEGRAGATETTGGAAIRVEVAFSPSARDVSLAVVELPAGSRLADALRACPWPVLQRLPEARPGSEAAGWGTGVWGRAQPLDHPLRDGDRVEVWRPLKVDPKEARRERSERAGGIRALRQRQRALREKGPTAG